MKLPIPRVIARASARRRLWLGAGAVALFLGTLAVVSAVGPYRAKPGRTLAVDYIAFYTAGHFVHVGRADLLYDLPATQRYQHAMVLGYGEDIGSACGPWWNPPFYALVFAPLSRLPYPAALDAWMGINLLCAAGAFWLLLRMLPAGLGWRTRALVPVLTVLSTPFIHAMSHAQNTCTSLLILTTAVTFWRANRGLAAGLVGGLMFYKPQLGAVLAGVMVLDLGLPAVAGFAISGTTLLLINLLALPGTLGAYLHQMPANLHHVQSETLYVWHRHVTFTAFWRLLLQGGGVGRTWRLVTLLSLSASAAIGLLLAGAIWRSRIRFPENGALRRDRLISATIVATPLLMPFYFDYDQLLLVVPAVLVARELIFKASSYTTLDQSLLTLAPIYYAWLMINPDVAERTHFNGTVLLLSGIAVMLIARLAQVAASSNSTQVASDSQPAFARAA